FADDVGVAVQHGGPEPVGQDDGAGSIGAVVAHVEEATEDRVQAHDVEIGAADDAGANFTGFTQTDHGKADRGKVAEGADGLDAGAEILEFGNGEVDLAHAEAGCGLLNIDQGVLVAIDQRPEKDAADQGKDGRVGADAQREGEDHGEGQTFR